MICRGWNAFAKIVLAGVLIARPGAAFGWGDEGHEIVGAVAIHYLTPATKQRIVAILSADTDPLTGHTIVNETTWADRYRDSDRNTTKVRYNQTRQWHFVDIELATPDINAACFGNRPLPPGTSASAGPADDCVVRKIEQFIVELKSPGTSSEERLFALKFLLHFVGDMHQPLHASDDHDAGGNQKTVTAAGSATGNLHHYWDTVLVQRLGTDLFVVADQLMSKVTKAQASQWSKGTPTEWAKESFEAGKAHAYHLPVPNAQGRYQLSTQYVTDATKTVSMQLSRAGVRLASILNSIFDPQHL